MMAVPYRKDFMDALAADGSLSQAEVDEALLRCAAAIETVRVKLWQFFKEHGLEDLP